ncbi:hypothetical protein [Chroococcidiopsis sp. CCNUC1]|uniref:DUF6887 family protein n=1 Tax=Chroococcidiopsis sp. CCNUC1 TaxID=2653189 RepID=UPI00202025DB|nr:hypothetical protein [Chroococcidiopsis sp. CCNUC1]URD47841.1 hypothetical protein M5J74_16000 [Chroococcidiopsis sp. CCNUC1]
MTKQQLIAYIKKHRTDDEAIHELFVNRRQPNAIKYPAEQTQAEIEQILRDKLELDKS